MNELEGDVVEKLPEPALEPAAEQPKGADTILREEILREVDRRIDEMGARAVDIVVDTLRPAVRTAALMEVRGALSAIGIELKAGGEHFGNVNQQELAKAMGTVLLAVVHRLDGDAAAPKAEGEG